MNDSTNEKRPYVPPQLTVVTFKAEQGYAFSNLRNYIWGVSQLWGASEANNSTADYSWGSDQNW